MEDKKQNKEYRDEEDIHYGYKQLATVTKKIQDSQIICPTNKKHIMRFKLFLQSRNITLHKVSRYLYDIHNFSVWLNKPFEEATKEDIQQVIVDLDYKISETTHRTYSEWSKKGFRVVVKMFYKWFEDCDEDDPYPKKVSWIKSGIKKGKTDKQTKQKEVLLPNEVNKLIDCCLNIRDKALVATLFDLGCRVGEFLRMRVGDLEKVSETYETQLRGMNEGGRPGYFAISIPYLLNWLNEHPFKSNSESYVWIKKNGKRISYGRVCDLLKDTAKRAGIKKPVNPHNFRHSRATYYGDKVPERVLMELFGWSSHQTVSIYTHIDGKRIKNAALKANGKDIIEETSPSEIISPICMKCGSKENSVTDIFCRKCSFPLNKDTAEKQVEDTMKRKRIDMFMDIVSKKPEFWKTVDKIINEELTSS